MKLIKWMCECGVALPDYVGYEYIVCEKCGTKYRVDNPVVIQPIQYPYITQPVYVPYAIEPSWWQHPYKSEPDWWESPCKTMCGDTYTCSDTFTASELRTMHGG